MPPESCPRHHALTFNFRGTNRAIIMARELLTQCPAPILLGGKSRGSWAPIQKGEAIPSKRIRKTDSSLPVRYALKCIEMLQIYITDNILSIGGSF